MSSPFRNNNHNAAASGSGAGSAGRSASSGGGGSSSNRLFSSAMSGTGGGGGGGEPKRTSGAVELLLDRMDGGGGAASRSRSAPGGDASGGSGPMRVKSHRSAGGGRGMRSDSMVVDSANKSSSSAASRSGSGSGVKGGGGIGKRSRSNQQTQADGRPSGSSSSAAASRRHNPIGGARSTAGSGSRGGGRSASKPSSSQSGEHIKVMKEWVKTRFRGPGVVDLSNMSADETLLSNEIFPPGHPKALSQVGDVLLKMIREQDPHTHTLSLARNNLVDLKQFHSLGVTLPHLRALDLSHNPELRRIGQLEDIATKQQGSTHVNGLSKSGGIRMLVELVLVGSGLRTEAEASNGLDQYVRSIITRFPNLVMLDGQAVPRIVFDVPINTLARPTDLATFDALKAQPMEWPAQVQPSHADSPAVAEFVNAFMAKYFALFDGDRSQLLPAYAEDATVSFSHTHNLPIRSRLAGLHRSLPHQDKPSWSEWADGPSRNLLRAGQGKRNGMLIINRGEALVKWLSDTVPKTAHPLSEAAKWVYDVVELETVAGMGRVLLTVHGEFQELPSEGLRSFSRVFVLGIATPGSMPANAGWSAVILSDKLAVRCYCSNDNFSAALPTSAIKAPVGSGQLPPDIAALPDLAIDQKHVVAAVQAQTNLQTQWALQCAAVASFQLEGSLGVFQQQQAAGAVPPSYFRS